MPESTLADIQFFIVGEKGDVASALTAYLKERGALVKPLESLNALGVQQERDTVLVAHYSDTENLKEKLPEIKRDDPSLRVMLLHEIPDRGKIESEILTATDQLLEKPFTRATLDKALSQLRFQPLENRKIFLYESAREGVALNVLKNLGASLVTSLKDDQAPLDLAVFAPDAITDEFRDELLAFRKTHADVPAFMLYNPQGAGILDAEILNEIAYLLQQPVSRAALRQRLLSYFEQPQKERRKNPRKKGVSQVWVSAFNLELGVPELFESPYLIDLSQSGLSFQTYIRYTEGQLMAVWIVAEEYPEKIIDLRGNIRWIQKDEGSATHKQYKYGIEFARQDSEAYRMFAQMVAMR